jgi:hypothetical protein
LPHTCKGDITGHRKIDHPLNIEEKQPTMKNIFRPFYLALAFITLTASIKAQTTGGLYLAYRDNAAGPTYAYYWNNGKSIKLTDGKTFAQAFDITLSGNDVYVCGEVYNNNGDPVATYWKNGKPFALANGKTYSTALALAVSHSDVHVIGKNGGVAMYWKNGIGTAMGKETTLTDVFVAGTDVYISGYQPDENGDYVATYWKNGKAVKLASAVPGAEANGIAVSGTDVYVAGKGTNKNREEIAVFWKNGKETRLAGGTGAKAVSISGNDVYFAGFERNAKGTNIAVAWKNGAPTRLTNDKGGAGVNNMATSGQDVYVTGYIEGQATYWKNGKTVVLPNITGDITGIFLK